MRNRPTSRPNGLPPSIHMTANISNRGRFNASQLKLDGDEIFKEANNHDGLPLLNHGGLQSLDRDGADIPRFDNVSQYGVNQTTYDKLLRMEIGRLIQVARNPDSYMFCSDGDFGDITEANFADLAKVADMIDINGCVTQLDNSSLVLEKATVNGAIMHGASAAKSCYSYLHRRYKGTYGQRAQPPVPISPPEKQRSLYFKMVDYITGTCFRLLTRVAKGGNWNVTTIALLAKLSLKLKVLARDSKANGLASLDNADRVIEEFEQRAEPTAVIILTEYMENERRKEMYIAFGNDDISPADLYLNNGLYLRNLIHGFVLGALGAIDTNNDRKKGFPALDMCSVTYQAGLAKYNVIVSQERGGEVTTTSSEHYFKASRAALTLFRQNIENISDTQRANLTPPRTQPVDVEPVYLTVDWLPGAEEENPDLMHGTIQASGIDDLVSAFLPLSLSNPNVAEKVEKLINCISWDKETAYPIQWFEQSQFQTRCCIQSHSAIEELRKFSLNHLDTVPVSQSGLIKPIRVGTLIDEDWRYPLPERSRPIRFQPVQGWGSSTAGSVKAQSESQKNDHKMDQWVFDTSSVTIKCRGYVYTVLGVCAAIVCGGVAIPFSVGSRIDGVDPFQITSFCWLLVGVILIAAKSRYVTEWPWHDFLHGHVVCRSVSDLADVSGVDKQTILAKLLSNEGALRLKTKGPFNGMFNPDERHDSGFSINEPMRISTMIASGFLVLKVASQVGEHLVCLDGRKTKARARREVYDEEHLSCLNMPNMDPEAVSQMKYKAILEESPVVFLSLNKISWLKIVGLYTDIVAFGPDIR
ncbi:hypothetical protein PGQ11_013377 [Apiospora arundinis]|uniref:Uncharacterized protein n=1 Tax=Apiospora arundinis TaxID=335852 RepID=A0ABR2HPP1_9PEZI